MKRECNLRAEKYPKEDRFSWVGARLSIGGVAKGFRCGGVSEGVPRLLNAIECGREFMFGHSRRCVEKAFRKLPSAIENFVC